jgi:hypothetical protein
MSEFNELDFSNTLGHAIAFFKSPMAGAYEYDPADDGPECEVITRVLASHKLYRPGNEGELLRFHHFVDSVARHMYGKHYARLGEKRKEKVRAKVIALHLGEDFKGTAYWTLGRLFA